MKTSPFPLGGRVLAGMLCLLAISNASAQVAQVPRGTLTVDRDLVRVGTRSQLNWQIEYPAPVTSVVEILSSNSITAKRDMKMRVRVLGVSFQEAKSNNGHGNNADGVDSSNPGQGRGGPTGAIDPSGSYDDELKGAKYFDVPVELAWNKGGLAWAPIFRGRQTDVTPTLIVLETAIKAGDTLNFGGQGWLSGGWLPFHGTGTATGNLVLLKNGDPAPASVTRLNTTLIEDFLKPYVDLSTQKMKIGNRDLILLMELDQTDTSNSGFDLQDLVVLVTFE